MKQISTKIKLVAAVIATTFMLASCNSNYEKANSGMMYKITHGSGKEKIKNKQVAKFFIEYRLSGKDTVLKTNYGKMPAFMMVDTTHLNKYDFTEILTKLAEGDKAEFILSVDTLKKWGAIPKENPLFKKGSSIKGKIEIIKVFASDSAAHADYDAEMKKDEARKQVEQKGMLEKQTKELKTYADKNKIKYVVSPLGVLVEVQNEGVGPKADSSKYAKVLYKGYLMNGKVFDSNNDTTMHKPALDVHHNVFPGFEDGLKYFGKGGKGRLLVPSPLAYGEGESGGPIPPNSNLIFDIEVIDVTAEAPKPSVKAIQPIK